MSLQEKILSHDKNKVVFRFLELSQEELSLHLLKPWPPSFPGFNEGARIFFNNYGEHIPAGVKFLLGIHSIMVNDITGEIFAFHTGRFSVFFKCDLARAGIQNSPHFRKGYTLDCITDIAMLGDEWFFMDEFDNPKEQLLWSYELAQK